MRLLFDQHISRRVVRLLKDTFPESHHIKYFQLEQASDEEIWDLAKHNGYTIVTKDNDFHQKSLLFGAPPKVVWVKLGNTDNATPETFLRVRAETIHKFLLDANAALPKETAAQVLGKQLLRSATSLGANYREANRARSDS